MAATTRFINLNDPNAARLLRALVDPDGLRHLGRVKRGSSFSLPIQFVAPDPVTSLLTAQDLGGAATGLIGFKAKANHNATGYCANAAWVKSGTGTSSLYTFSLTFLNSVMNALFAIGDSAAADEVPYVDLVGEIKWTDTNGIHQTQSDFALRVMNDVNQGGETSSTIPQQASAVVLPQITRQTGGVLATDLDAQALVAFPNLTCFDIVVDVGGGTFSASRWQKRNDVSHATDTAAGYILCLDTTQLIRVSGY